MTLDEMWFEVILSEKYSEFGEKKIHWVEIEIAKEFG